MGKEREAESGELGTNYAFSLTFLLVPHLHSPCLLHTSKPMTGGWVVSHKLGSGVEETENEWGRVKGK